MTKRDMSALTMSELQEEFKRNGRRYWRLAIPMLVSFFGLIGVAFGVNALFGVGPFLVVMGLDALVFTGWMVAIGLLQVRQIRLRFEIARRQRSAGP